MNAHGVFLSTCLAALLLCSACQSLPQSDAQSSHPHARPAVRRRLDALPGFNVGTQPEGMDVARNGVVTVWQKWDPQKTWAQAGVASNTFYAWYLPRDDPPPGRNITFTIEAARVANGAGIPNEANCSVVTTPAVGTPIVAGNFSASFSAAYTCNSTGQVEIEVTLAIAGYSSIGITYVKTNGNALDVGLTPTSAEVVSRGITTSAFSMANPVFVVPYEEEGSTMYLRIAPGQIPFTKHELRTSDFTVTTIPDHVVDVDLSGSASTAMQINQSALELQVNYTCKTDKQLASTVIQLEWAMVPFSPIAFSWLKDCSKIIGFNITQNAGPHAPSHPVVVDGIVRDNWKNMHYFSALVTELTFTLTSTKQPVVMAAPKLVGATTVCTVAVGGTAGQGGTVTATGLSLTLSYSCPPGSQGIQNDTVVLDFGKFGTVSFDTTKFVGYRPAFDLILEPSEVNVTTVPLTDLHVLSSGLAVANWSDANAYSYLLPPNVGALRMMASVSEGMPFQLGSPFSVVTPSHSGQCDPHIRPNPQTGGDGAYRLDAVPQLVEVTFWCKTNTLDDHPRFVATFDDVDEYLTSRFSFRKATNIVESFAVTTDNGTQVMQGGVAINGWDSTGHVHVEVSYSGDDIAQAAFIVDNADHVITSVEVLPYVTPIDAGTCAPHASIDQTGSHLTVVYNCTFADPPIDGASGSLNVDVIVIFHTMDPDYPQEQFSPPMMHWDVTLTYTSPTAKPNVLVWILASAGGVVVIVLIIILVMRISRPRDRSRSFQAAASRPLHEPIGAPSAPSQRVIRDAPLEGNASVTTTAASGAAEGADSQRTAYVPPVQSDAQQTGNIDDQFAQQFDALNNFTDSDSDA